MSKLKDNPLFCIERTGEKIQARLVEIANDIGDCDDSADLAEVVAVLDRLESEYDALNKVVEIAKRVSNDWDDNYEALQSAIADLDKLRKS